MDEKMTSGEIAKKAGVSQKAVRLYDEKGLLKPSGYSDGNYRLYDKEALQILEKIVALKQIGFSLEEIRDNLTSGDAKNIEEALRIQLKVMEEKRYRTEMVIDAINRTLARQDGSLDWDDVANIVQSVSLDQEADRNHWGYINHALPGEDWYVTVYDSLDFSRDQKVLDLGCGYSKLWRNNWERIPEGIKISAYDIRGSWADDFEAFLQDNRSSLPEGVDIDLTFSDIEKDRTWDKISSAKPYDRIIAHYVWSELKDPEALMSRASEVLAPGGVFSVNGPASPSFMIYFGEAMKDAGIDAPFIDEILADKARARDEFIATAERHFAKVSEVELPSSFRYDDALDLLNKMKDLFEGQGKFFEKNQDKILSYFDGKIKPSGELVIKTTGYFLHCSN